jgi:polysaccharide export outer membrane protein
MPTPTNRIILFLLSTALFNAQLSIRSAVAQSANTTTAAQNEYLLIGSGDLVDVTVFREPELETKVRVDAIGNITLPLINSIHIAGLTPQQAEKVMEESYEKSNYLKAPQISLLVDEYATQSISVVGEVQKAGSYPATAPRSVIDAIALAGGLTVNADRHITIQHRGSLNDKEEVFLSNNSDKALAAQVKVYPGDIVMVPKAGVVYVLGDVHQPGGYVMQDDSKMSALQAIAMAAGINTTAVGGQVRLVRRTAEGSTTEITISLKDMQKGKVPDMQLRANDVLWVPFSFGKNFMMSGSSILSVASSAAVYRF